MSFAFFVCFALFYFCDCAFQKWSLMSNEFPTSREENKTRGKYAYSKSSRASSTADVRLESLVLLVGMLRIISSERPSNIFKKSPLYQVVVLPKNIPLALVELQVPLQWRQSREFQNSDACMRCLNHVSHLPSHHTDRHYIPKCSCACNKTSLNLSSIAIPGLFKREYSCDRSSDLLHNRHSCISKEILCLLCIGIDQGT
jgi:hypothetical protein